jgi:cation diffusion facilitator family transporter
MPNTRGIQIKKQSERAAILSIVIAAAMAILKAAVGLLSGALVLLTDALDSVADIFSSLAAYIGIRLSNRQPDERFQFGYHKAESLAALFISGFIVYAAIVFMVRGFNRLFELPDINYPLLTMSVALLSSAVGLVMHLYLKHVGEKHRSQGLIANSKDRLKDFFASIVVFLGILFAVMKIPYVEGAITIAISLLILRIGLLTMKDSAFTLMDVSPDIEVEDKVSSILTSTPGVMNVYGTQLRKVGSLIFGNATIQVKKSVSVKRAHDIADSVEKRVKRSIPGVESFVIHVEPYRSDRQKLLIPLKEDKGMNSLVEGQFGKARHLMFITLDNGRIVSTYVKKTPSRKKKAGFSLAKDMLAENIDAIILHGIGEISFHTLRDNLVEVYKCNGRTAEQVVKNYRKTKCTYLRKPTRSSASP